MPRSSLSSNSYSDRVIRSKYYPHIDGIRALAVLPVVLFHVLASLCPGGYTGVDVFFVVSGYLITGGIVRDLKHGRFSISSFYHRRIRRIIPAYFTLIIGVFIIGCVIYYSTPLIHLGDATVMGTLFSANLYFWGMGSDYFSPDINLNPLLHLWSLSVEEQFYLFVPIVAAMVWRYCRKCVKHVFAIFAFFSLVAAIWAVATGKQNSAFYLFHYRAWELLAGSLLALCANQNLRLPTKPGHKLHRGFQFPLVSHCIHAFPGVLGLLMVLLPYALLSSDSPFPGATAISSVLGTMCLIRYGSTGWISRLLSWRIFVAIGKISYSLYLWHWPVTVFWKYVVYDDLYWFDYVGMFLLSIFLGYLSWRFVEMPVRLSQKWTMKRSFVFAAAGIVLLVSLGVSCVFNHGWPTKLNPVANSLTNNRPRFVEGLIRNKIRQVRLTMGHQLPHDDFVSFKLGGGGDFHLGVEGIPEVFVIGDSHAGALQYGLDVALREQKHSGYVMNRGATPYYDLDTPECQSFLAELAKYPETSRVLLVQFWANNNDTVQAYAKLEVFSAKIASLGKTLFIATGVPFRRQSPSDIAARRSIVSPRHSDNEWNDGIQRESIYDEMQGEINHNLEAVAKKTGAFIIPMHLAFKQGGEYLSFDVQKGRTIPLYQDKHHVSPNGSLRAARFIMPYIFPSAGVGQ